MAAKKIKTGPKLERPRGAGEEFMVEARMQQMYGKPYMNPEDAPEDANWVANLKANTKAMLKAKKSTEAGGQEGRLDVPAQIEGLGGRKRVKKSS